MGGRTSTLPNPYFYFVFCFLITPKHTHTQHTKAVKGEEDPTHYYHGYIWITLGWYHKQWWMAEVARDNEVNCTDDELERLLERTIAIQQFPTADNKSAPTNVSLVSWNVCKLCFGEHACEGNMSQTFSTFLFPTLLSHFSSALLTFLPLHASPLL